MLYRVAGVLKERLLGLELFNHSALGVRVGCLKDPLKEAFDSSSHG